MLFVCGCSDTRNKLHTIIAWPNQPTEKHSQLLEKLPAHRPTQLAQTISNSLLTSGPSSNSVLNFEHIRYLLSPSKWDRTSTSILAAGSCARLALPWTLVTDDGAVDSELEKFRELGGQVESG